MQVQNGYKLKKGTSLGTPTTMPAPMPKDVVITPQQSQNSASVTSAQTQAADAAAQKIADAENKSYLAAKAVELSEEISRQAEDSEAMLQLANEIYAQCNKNKTYNSLPTIHSIFLIFLHIRLDIHLQFLWVFFFFLVVVAGCQDEAILLA